MDTTCTPKAAPLKQEKAKPPQKPTVISAVSVHLEYNNQFIHIFFITLSNVKSFLSLQECRCLEGGNYLFCISIVCQM